METAQHPTTDLMLGSPFLTWPFPTIVPVVPLQPLPSIVVATAKLTALHWPNPAPKRSQRTSIQLFLLWTQSRIPRFRFRSTRRLCDGIPSSFLGIGSPDQDGPGYFWSRSHDITNRLMTIRGKTLGHTDGAAQD